MKRVLMAALKGLALVALMHSVSGWAQTCTLTCPANITVGNDANQCGGVVNYSAPLPNDAALCGTITSTPAAGSFFPVGTTTVTATSTGGGTCTFTVTVNDTQPPQITCPANITTLAPFGESSAVVTFSPNTSDNCPGVTFAASPPSGSTFPSGSTTDTATSTDASGNTASCTFSIFVLSNIPAQPVPMLGNIGLIGAGLLLALAAAFALRRKMRR